MMKTKVMVITSVIRSTALDCDNDEGNDAIDAADAAAAGAVGVGRWAAGGGRWAVGGGWWVAVAVVV